MTFLAATAGKERLKTCATKRLISIGSRSAFDFGRLVALGAATAEATKTSHPKQSEDGRYLHRKLNDFPSRNGGKGKVKDARD